MARPVCTQSKVVNRLQVLGHRKVLTLWIPHALSDNMRFTRIFICHSLLFRSSRKEYLKDLITENRSRVLYDSNAQRAVWLPRGQQPPMRESRTYTSRKFFYAASGKGVLCNELQTRAHSHRCRFPHSATEIRGSCSRKRPPVHLLHDNARSHAATKKPMRWAGKSYPNRHIQLKFLPQTATFSGP